MYILKDIANGKYITFICSPKFVKMTKNNCLGNATEYDADGIFHNGILYQINGRKGKIANAVYKVNLEKINDGEMLFYLYNQIEQLKKTMNSEEVSDNKEGEKNGT